MSQQTARALSLSLWGALATLRACVCVFERTMKACKLRLGHEGLIANGIAPRIGIDCLHATNWP